MFEVGQSVTRSDVDPATRVNFLTNIIKRFLPSKKARKLANDLEEMSDNRPDDVFVICGRRIQTDRFGVRHVVYICYNKRKDEYTIFGNTGLKLNDQKTFITNGNQNTGRAWSRRND